MLFLQMPYELFQSSIYFLTQSRGYKHSILRQIPQTTVPRLRLIPRALPRPALFTQLDLAMFCRKLIVAMENAPYSCYPPTKKVVASMWSKHRRGGHCRCPLGAENASH